MRGLTRDRFSQPLLGMMTMAYPARAGRYFLEWQAGGLWTNGGNTAKDANGRAMGYISGNSSAELQTASALLDAAVYGTSFRSVNDQGVVQATW